MTLPIYELIHVLAVKSANGACIEPNFLGLVPWYHYLNVDGKCEIVNFTVLNSGKSSDIPLILLVVVDDLLRIAGIVAVAFVVYGAIQYITSQGEPDKTAKAQSTIINSLVGLGISIVAVTLVTFLGNKIGAN